jgi:hypothetical protein
LNMTKLGSWGLRKWNLTRSDRSSRARQRSLAWLRCYHLKRPGDSKREREIMQS